MSRLYEMEVTIEGFDPDKAQEIQDAAQEQWPFEEDWSEDEETMSAHGQSNLCGGEMDCEFAKRLTKAIFEANGGPCKVKVDATYMENLPFEVFEFDKDNLP